MSNHIILVDDITQWKKGFPDYAVVAVRDYLVDPSWSNRRTLRVINLCRDTDYHSPGYYASLLAEARGHKVIPSVRTLQDLSRKALYGSELSDLDRRIEKLFRDQPAEVTRFEVLVCFGQCEAKGMRRLATALFDTFRAPLIKVELKRDKVWHITSIRSVGLKAVKRPQREFFFAAMAGYLRRPWRESRDRRQMRYDLAILYDPQEQTLAPSDRRALANFIRAARAEGIDAELITARDFGRLAEFDALFIRETTNVNHYTYRFARRAASEGMPVIDDPDSILRCTNKIYLAELLARHKIATPASVILGPDELDRAEQQLAYPMVLKIPDGAFSTGVFKVKDRTEFEDRAQTLFRSSELILAQAYTPTDFDWRIGILNNEVLFACRYYMARGHWQIADHSGPRIREGNFDTLPLDEVPPTVLHTALKAANAIGNGLYGVDLKQVGERVLVIEVNDNPNIDATIEDKVLGMELYRRVMREFLRRLEARGR
ncbi:MAG: RimK family protein [Chromatiaceae bacterium]|nr:RimK family protein [Gammaproteobacteria bacterium]MCP5300157.1 RimK family protein [Chromatiaceae bacterium]MCP5422229.1 RimK family protein [Chromatiaceae bacterium]